jgi:hypothetical protein
MSPNIQVTVNSNRQFQRELEVSIAQNYPDIKPEIIVRKALDAFQTTMLVVSSVNLLVNIIRLILDLKRQHPNTEIEIGLLSGKKSRSLKITTEQSLDVNEVIKDFMGENQGALED